MRELGLKVIGYRRAAAVSGSSVRQVRGLDFAAIVKPHIGVAASWAGAIEPASEQAWHLGLSSTVPS